MRETHLETALLVPDGVGE